MIEPGRPPRELNRLDSKNWTPTPEALQRDLAGRVTELADRVDALILLDQVDLPETGVVTALVKQAAAAALRANPGLIILADSRRGLSDFPSMGFKMNAAELARMAGTPVVGVAAVQQHAADLSACTGGPVFVTLAEQGIVGASPWLRTRSRPGPPGPRRDRRRRRRRLGNGLLASALASGASQREAMELAMAAASVVIHQLGTTGTASVTQLRNACILL